MFKAEVQMDEEIGPGDAAQGRFGCLRDSWRHLRGIGGAGVTLVSIDKIQGERGEPLQAGVVSRGVPQTLNSGKVISGEHKAVKSGRAIGGKGNSRARRGWTESRTEPPPDLRSTLSSLRLQQEVNAA